ncbi:MAG: Unknown protein [uncultured Sulfurovum sp.]|uniref:LysM domain-containing protein n=1 Tax=uncultured Sulfurovum sp. TaxID=269237 RepID=A0A6S6TUR9_9BACT|nr:MAG: Unknown protein [uncultured Sulfurovum sp.]
MKKIVFLSVCCFYISMANETQNIQNANLELKLTQTLKNLKEYKLKKDRTILNLEKALKKVKAELKNTKKQLTIKNKKHNKALKRMRKDLQETKKNFLKVRNELSDLRNEKSAKSMKINKMIQTAINQPLIIENVTKEALAPIPPKSIATKLSWVEVVIEDDINIRELALKYYSDSEAYPKIYAANRSVIPASLKIQDGMILKIPITDNFKEQPMILNRD